MNLPSLDQAGQLMATTIQLAGHPLQLTVAR
jgi:hypothetical protein